MSSAALTERPASHLWKSIQKVLREKRLNDVNRDLIAETTFYIFRTDNNAVLARGVDGYEAAKARANALRKQYGLKWDQISFKAERRAIKSQGQFGISADGRTFTNAFGERGRMVYSPRYNSSKGGRFRGYYDKNGDFHDLD